MQGSWVHGRSCGWPREGNIFKVIFISKFFSCRFQDNPSSVRNNSNGGRKKERRKLQKKKKGKRLLFLVLILHFISVGKSPLIFFFFSNLMHPGNMPFRILAWELQTKLVREAKCVSGNFEEAGSRAGSQSFVRSTPSPVSTKPEPTRESELCWPRDSQHLFPPLSPRGLGC